MEMCGRSRRRCFFSVGRIAQRDALLIEIEITLQEAGAGQLATGFRPLLGFLHDLDRFWKAAIFRIGGGQDAGDHQVTTA